MALARWVCLLTAAAALVHCRHDVNPGGEPAIEGGSTSESMAHDAGRGRVSARCGDLDEPCCNEARSAACRAPLLCAGDGFCRPCPWKTLQCSVPEAGAACFAMDDPRHCGRCDNQCAPGQACSAGDCVAPCAQQVRASGCGCGAREARGIGTVLSMGRAAFGARALTAIIGDGVDGYAFRGPPFEGYVFSVTDDEKTALADLFHASAFCTLPRDMHLFNVSDATGAWLSLSNAERTHSVSFYPLEVDADDSAAVPERARFRALFEVFEVVLQAHLRTARAVDFDTFTHLVQAKLGGLDPARTKEWRESLETARELRQPRK